jgi:ubiquinone/menaquinone biosynthesis C-methylase UbiE
LRHIAMTIEDADEKNGSQISFWNGDGARHWINRRESWDIVLGTITDILFEHAGVQQGELVVDIGCGCGTTTFELARLVSPAGYVLGIDVSAPMLACAAERRPPGLSIEWVLADATTFAFDPDRFDLLFSRFGIMFFADPVRSFRNLHAALRPGGRLAFVCSRTFEENVWMKVPLEAAYEHVSAVPVSASQEPDPFSFAYEERFRSVLSEADFRSILCTPVDLMLDIGGGQGLDAAVASSLEIGATSKVIDNQSSEIRRAVAESIRRALMPYQRDAAVLMPAALWYVTARKE